MRRWALYENFSTTRLRRSPYYEATVADGVSGFTTYNRMLMPTSYGDEEAEYWRLIDGVTQWDVAVQRQIQLSGPDAANLVQVLSPRDLSQFAMGQGKYVGLCDHRGTLINDPILLKLDDDQYWLSIADSDILLWSRAIASERGFRVNIVELDVAPMALQGPKAEEVACAIFGDWVRDLQYFWFRETEVEGIPLLLSRSGWSKQGGFELYLLDHSKGVDLWNIVREAGAPWDIGPGYPNPCERIESGLLSWGGDTDDATNPFEVRLDNYIDLNVPDDVIGIKALRDIKANGPLRHQLGLILDDAIPQSFHTVWHPIMSGNHRVGDMTNGIWSRRFNRTIGYALVHHNLNSGDEVEVMRDDLSVSGILTDLPFIGV